MHSELHSKHLLLKGAVHSASSYNLLLEYILSLHFLYTQKSMFKIQLRYFSTVQVIFLIPYSFCVQEKEYESEEGWETR